MRRTRSRRLAGAARSFRSSQSPRPGSPDRRGGSGGDDGGLPMIASAAVPGSPREGDLAEDSDTAGGGGETSGGGGADGADGEDVSGSPAVVAVNVSCRFPLLPALRAPL